jgi:LmbE family N-acetylglucosaminyl deacetylase
VYEACFLAGLRNYSPELGVAFRPFKLVYALGITEPVHEQAGTFLVDVSAVWDQKLRAIRAFASQFTPAPGETVALPFERFQDTVEMSSRHLGARIGVRYAEAFVTREPLAIEDLTGLVGRSI